MRLKHKITRAVLYSSLRLCGWLLFLFEDREPHSESLLQQHGSVDDNAIAGLQSLLYGQQVARDLSNLY